MKKSLGGGLNLPHPNWNRVKHCFNELKKRVLLTVFVRLMFQSKYIHLNLTIYMSYFKIFSFSPLL